MSKIEESQVMALTQNFVPEYPESLFAAKQACGKNAINGFAPRFLALLKEDLISLLDDPSVLVPRSEPHAPRRKRAKKQGANVTMRSLLDLAEFYRG